MKHKDLIIKTALKKTIPVAVAALSLTVAESVIMWVYDLPSESVFYCSVVGLLITISVSFVFVVTERRRAALIEDISKDSEFEWSRRLNEEIGDKDLSSHDYHYMIDSLSQRLREGEAAFDEERQDMLDYYTAWVHQIKTPIAVIRLELQDKDTDESRKLMSELFRIERYVDMVLQYVRLGSESNDLMIREYDLQELLRESVRKYASQFIAAKVTLDLKPVSKKIITDKKWFAVIVEQILSNAIKYAPEGKVTIELDSGERLVITDNGIGIGEEDLPRIFEKGYTGKNGRLSVNSSGLGLYLCKSAADKLNIPLRARSAPDRGASFILDLSGQGKGFLFD